MPTRIELSAGLLVKRVRGRTLPQWALVEMPRPLYLVSEMRRPPHRWSISEMHRHTLKQERRVKAKRKAARRERKRVRRGVEQIIGHRLQPLSMASLREALTSMPRRLPTEPRTYGRAVITTPSYRSELSRGVVMGTYDDPGGTVEEMMAMARARVDEFLQRYLNEPSIPDPLMLEDALRRARKD